MKQMFNFNFCLFLFYITFFILDCFVTKNNVCNMQYFKNYSELFSAFIKIVIEIHLRSDMTTQTT